MPNRSLVCLGIAVCSTVSIADANDLTDADGWSAAASDGVSVELRIAPGRDEGGRALRLAYDFTQGAGFVVLRKPVDLSLPENYRFSFAVRGDGPANNLEFKLIDPSGDNVWWVNRRSFNPPQVWTELRQQRRHFEFAWGPAGPDQPLKQVGALEFAIAAAEGGRGYIEIDDLTLAERPAPRPPTTRPQVQFSSNSAGAVEVQLPHPSQGAFVWTPASDDSAPQILVDFGETRAIGGLRLDWKGAAAPRAYVIEVLDGEAWRLAAEVRGSDGERDYVATPDVETDQVRLRFVGDAQPSHATLERVALMPAEFADYPNNVWRRIAQDALRGLYPRYYLGEAQPWTVVGAPENAREALFCVSGALEVDKGAFRVEPFLRLGERLVTWADVDSKPSLPDDYLPLPEVKWSAADLPVTLQITAIADDAGAALIDYRIENVSDSQQAGSLYLALRPFQVLPPWQSLNLIGGATSIRAITYHEGFVLVSDEAESAYPIASLTPVSDFGATTFAGGEIVEHLRRGELPTAGHASDDVVAVEDIADAASGALAYRFDLGPGEVHRVVVRSDPRRSASGAGARRSAAAGMSSDAAAETYDAAHDATLRAWREAIGALGVTVPPSAQVLADSWRSQQAYILVNADGPGIQPGSRTYERSWIRDGALTSTALLHTGHREQVRRFIDWFAPYQYPSGKIPCVVDQRGADPVPEHDSHGQFVHLLWTYYRFTGDDSPLSKHFDRVVKVVDYIESLRAQRMTDEFRQGPPEKRMLYGLVPESISHEGYSAKPMHSYWDGFFVIRGLKDAVAIAEHLDRPAFAKRCETLLSQYRQSMYESMRQSMTLHDINYIPGCAELGDFDATSTTIGVYPAGELGRIPEPQLRNTFERYWRFFTERRDDPSFEWNDYTPYEIRNAGAFLRLDEPERAHALLNFFIADQAPVGWRQWGEVVHKDPQRPAFIGDYPHTWVGSDYLKTFRTIFVYERDRDDALVLASGVLPEWLSDDRTVGISDWPTPYGSLSYTLRRVDGVLRLEYALAPYAEIEATVPPGGVRLRPSAFVPESDTRVEVLDAVELSSDKVRGTLKASLR